MQGIEYRSAIGSDAHALAEYVRTVGGETDFLSYGKDTFNMSDEREARFIERFGKSEKDIMLIALEDGKIVANASLEASRVARYSHRSELSITVLKEYWGRGIGSRLMEIMIGFAKEKGIEFANQNKIAAVFILEDGSIHLTNSLTYNKENKIILK